MYIVSYLRVWLLRQSSGMIYTLPIHIWVCVLHCAPSHVLIASAGGVSITELNTLELGMLLLLKFDLLIAPDDYIPYDVALTSAITRIFTPELVSHHRQGTATQEGT